MCRCSIAVYTINGYVVESKNVKESNARYSSSSVCFQYTFYSITQPFGVLGRRDSDNFCSHSLVAVRPKSVRKYFNLRLLETRIVKDTIRPKCYYFVNTLRPGGGESLRNKTNGVTRARLSNERMYFKRKRWTKGNSSWASET